MEPLQPGIFNFHKKSGHNPNSVGSMGSRQSVGLRFEGSVSFSEVWDCSGAFFSIRLGFFVWALRVVGIISGASSGQWRFRFQSTGLCASRFAISGVLLGLSRVSGIYKIFPTESLCNIFPYSLQAPSKV